MTIKLRQRKKHDIHRETRINFKKKQKKQNRENKEYNPTRLRLTYIHMRKNMNRKCARMKNKYSNAKFYFYGNKGNAKSLS